MELNDQGIPTLKAARRLGMRLYAGAFGLQMLTMLLIFASVLYYIWHFQGEKLRYDYSFLAHLTANPRTQLFLITIVLASGVYVALAAAMGRWAGAAILHRGRSWLGVAATSILPAAGLANLLWFSLLILIDPQMMHDFRRDPEILLALLGVGSLGSVTLPGVVIALFCGLWMRYRRRAALDAALCVPMDRGEDLETHTPRFSPQQRRKLIAGLAALAATTWLHVTQAMMMMESNSYYSAPKPLWPYLLTAITFILTAILLASFPSQKGHQHAVLPVLMLATPLAAIAMRFLEIQADAYLRALWRTNPLDYLFLPTLDYMVCYLLAIIVPGILAGLASRHLLHPEQAPMPQ